MPKEVFGHCRGRVKSIPKADKGIGKRISQIVLKMSGKLTQPGSGKKVTYHREQNYASRQTQVSIVNWSIGYKKKSRQRGSFLYQCLNTLLASRSLTRRVIMHTVVKGLSA